MYNRSNGSPRAARLHRSQPRVPGRPRKATAETVRAQAAFKLNSLIARRGFTQLEASARLEMPQSKVSAIRNYKLHGISLERLLEALVNLDQRIEITVSSSTERRRPGIEVKA